MNSENQNEFLIGRKIYINHEVNFQILNLAYKALLKNYSILRTKITHVNGFYYQEVIPVVDQNIQFLDLRNQLNQEETLNEYLNLTDVIISTSQASLSRVYLIQLEDAKYILNYKFHHVIADGTTLSLFLLFMNEYYQRLKINPHENISGPNFQYHDFANEQRLRLTSTVLEKMKVYWEKKLFNPPLSEIQLSNEKTNLSAQQLEKRRVLLCRFSSKDNRLISDFCESNGILLMSFFLAVIFHCLRKWTSQDDLAIGSVFKGRQQEKLSDQLGLFTNTALFRYVFKGEVSGIEYIRQIQREVINVFKNQEYPYGALNDRDLTSYSNVGMNFLSERNSSSIKNNNKEREEKCWEETPAKGEWFFMMFTYLINDDITFSLEYPIDLFEYEMMNNRFNDLKNSSIQMCEKGHFSI